ncbi:MAG: hypothetical protein FJ280_15625, partial [Planctomycetes bacterium]|nr:hypothetical protein [Planctomycetota bacterium]
MVQDKGKPEEAIFKAAIQCQDRHQRQAYVWNACSGNPRLLAEVEVLLQYHDTNSFLDALALDPDVRLDEPVLTEGPGTVIGRYKLLEKIGEGGMAVVYMAEQEHPIRRKVALKIIKLGMDTRQVIARFEAERQALALMDHPSIAKVFDAGSTETGRPYFVMELVQGVSITEYCDKNNLCTKDRLHLFLQVCQAVQHAHTKGIIHRDIKPSNVMVTSHDGEALPKVIDFGIAKATNQKLTEKTLFTRYAHLIGTPAYMSPEQAQLSDLDIDTRSDIYSLGVLLYELLSGTTPFSEEELRKAGYLEMQRVIREQEPVKPSTRIRTALRGASVPARRGEGILPLRVAGILPALRRRPRTGEPLRVRLDTEETKAKMASGRKGGTPSPQLPYRRPAYEQVRGDLDWIVMKSLEKDRTRRYETASGLAEDIRRHLEHEPVLARGPSAVYRVGRFLRRHRSGVVGVAAFVVLLAGVALLLSIWKQDRLQWQQDRLQLAAADELRHQALLSQAQGQYAGGERDAALETIQPILDSPHVGGKAQLLRAGILVDNRRSEDAVAVLGDLLDEKPEIAGAAHSLLARILWESESPNTERLQEIEERRKKAEALLPETAEAHFLRAMTAITVKEQLAALDRALQLDPSHFESRRLRAFTFYASRKYDRLKDDALVMTVVRPRDALGYALRAVAGRELGRYREAMADYDLAIALTPSADPQHADLSIQRRETLLRMEDFERVIAETPPASQDLASPVLRYHTFGALTALGEYDTATILFREIIAPGREARQKFNNWCAKYVFDTLTAGRSWYLTDQGPTGAAFLPMIEAEETYRSLAGKGGRRLTVDGFSADWSPDAKKLAFSLGVHGHSGVAIFDPATKETDLLIVPGKDPRWSPDGKYIAFVRDRQFLRLSEFIAAVRRDQRRVLTDEEVWLMRADGTEPRRLTRGGWPSWNRDSTTVYYASRADYSLCSISVERENAEPNRIMACTWYYPSVSPDSRRVAYLEGGYLKVRDLASQSIVAQQPAPFKTSGGPTWSPTGGELSLGGPNHSEELTGLWVYDLGKSQPIGVLNGQVTAGSWAPDGTQFIFCLGPPYYEIWSADLDPQREKTSEAFTPTQTLDEHFRRMVGVYTNRVESDPTDANNYLQRAQ